jgi:hypothetical protein
MIDLSTHPELREGAATMVNRRPITITSAFAERSSGSRHDFYSEGDYWWPDLSRPQGPFLQLDGHLYPHAYWEHRKLLLRMVDCVASMVTTWLLTGDQSFAESAWIHLNGWFCDEKTRMNPHLRYAQAVSGVANGRCYGVVDTIHLTEVALAVVKLRRYGGLSNARLAGVLAWFEEFRNWLLNDEFGRGEKVRRNNHATCWLLQIATYSLLLEDLSGVKLCRRDFKHRILAKQMALDGSFPRELSRTRPYNYSLFNLELMACLCQVLAGNVWHYTTSDGRGMAKAFKFMFPYVICKDAWPFAPDVALFDELPQKCCGFLFASWAFKNPSYGALWMRLLNTESREMRRNLFARRPLLWCE